VLRFAHGYNHEHRHSAIRFVTPHQRHSRHEQALLTQCHALYAQACYVPRCPGETVPTYSR
jgi:putative transposase